MSDPTRIPVRPILDRQGVHVAPNGERYDGVWVLTGAERVALTVNARAAALRAAAEIAASGRRPADAASVIGLAEEFEAWLLREDPTR